MLNARRTLLKQAVAWLDAITLIASFGAAYFIVNWAFARRLSAFSAYLWLLGAIIPIWIAGLSISGLYRSVSYCSVRGLLSRLIEVQAMAGMVLLSMLFMTKSEQISRLLVDVFLVFSFAALTAQKLYIKYYLDRLASFAAGARHKVVLVGSAGDEAAYSKMISEHASMLTDVVGMITPAVCSGSVSHSPRLLGTVADFLNGGGGSSAVVDEVVAVSRLDSNTLNSLSHWCTTRGTTFRMLVEVPTPPIGIWTAGEINDGVFILSLATVPQRPGQLAIKRLIDEIGALAGIVLCGIVFLFYGSRLRDETGDSVLFSQQRVGRNGRRFTLYKFRTMYRDAESRLPELKNGNHMNGPMFKLKNDPRVTPTGRKLRRRHLDELPQFWNVLRGEMSLVGTRPPTEDEVAAYYDHHHRRLSMKPGLTGLWQLNGNGTVKDFEEVVKLDCEYIDNWSLWLDAKIVAKTIAKVMRGDGW